MLAVTANSKALPPRIEYRLMMGYNKLDTSVVLRDFAFRTRAWTGIRNQSLLNTFKLDKRGLRVS
jgi:hypothetical protein